MVNRFIRNLLFGGLITLIGLPLECKGDVIQVSCVPGTAEVNGYSAYMSHSSTPESKLYGDTDSTNIWRDVEWKYGPSLIGKRLVPLSSQPRISAEGSLVIPRRLYKDNRPFDFPDTNRSFSIVLETDSGSLGEAITSSNNYVRLELVEGPDDLRKSYSWDLRLANGVTFIDGTLGKSGIWNLEEMRTLDLPLYDIPLWSGHYGYLTLVPGVTTNGTPSSWYYDRGVTNDLEQVDSTVGFGGFTGNEKYVMGANSLTNDVDYFRNIGIEMSSGIPRITIPNSKTNRVYTIEGTGDLANSVWQETTSSLGNGGTKIFDIPTGEQNTRFYRGSVGLP